MGDIGGACWFVSHWPARWAEASTFCRSYHGDLAVIPNAATLSIAKSLIGGSEGDRYWIDGADLVREGDWLWASLETNSNIDLSSVGIARIEDDNDDADCLLIDRDDSNAWRAESCDDMAFFICHHEPLQSGNGNVIG